MRQSVAACIIAMNESERIGAALRSVAFCDDIIVVDGGSTDETPVIAEQLGARVVRNPWPGYGAQRNLALESADTEWVLEIDADERVSVALRAEIESFLAAPPDVVDMAVIPLRDVFLGKRLGPASGYPMYRCRLFRRRAYRHDERRRVHEGLWPLGFVNVFEADLEHILASSWREAITDCVHYARLHAEHRPGGGPTRKLLEVFVRPPAKLVYRLVALGGWRDGPAGVVRITLECSSDALSWILARPQAGEVVSLTPPHTGPIRVVGLAAGRRSGRLALAHLRLLKNLGADVALVAPLTSDGDVRVRRMASRGPLSIVRAIEAEAQVRPVDAIVAYDRAARHVARILPPRLRSLVVALDTEIPADELIRIVSSQMRPAVQHARARAS